MKAKFITEDKIEEADIKTVRIRVIVKPRNISENFPLKFIHKSEYGDDRLETDYHNKYL